MIHRFLFVARISVVVAAVSACGNSDKNDDGGQGSSGSGASGGSGGSSSGGSSSGGGGSSGSNSGGSNSGGSNSGTGGSTTGGAAGSMAIGGAAGTSASGSGGASSCPSALPPNRSSCNVPSLMCSYGQTVCTCLVSLGEPGGVFWLCGDTGSGGSGGSSSDPCGGCDEGELCIHQAGGPGPSRYLCADSPSCTVPIPGPCACVMGQGTCTYQMETTDAGAAGICVCDNGLD